MHTVFQPGTADHGTTREGAATTRVAVAGATGYTGQELLRLLSRHPAVTLTAAMSSGTTASARRLPALARVWNGAITPLSAETLEREADVVFLALPDSAAAELAPKLVAAGVRVVDLSGAFRLRDGAERGRWYPETHDVPASLAYGLTERERDAVRGAALVANPGCYPTAAILALWPLAPHLADVVIDAKSGVSGAGKTPSERTHFSECHGSLSAYGVFSHRHAVEIEQELGVEVTFVPHLLPIDRGILETIYATVRAGVTEADVTAAYHGAYASSRFVRLTGRDLPEIKHVAHTNFCDIGWRLQDRRRQLVIVACIDNLVKGAAGQAVQNFNVAFGLDEDAGLN